MKVRTYYTNGTTDEFEIPIEKVGEYLAKMKQMCPNTVIALEFEELENIAGE